MLIDKKRARNSGATAIGTAVDLLCTKNQAGRAEEFGNATRSRNPVCFSRSDPYAYFSAALSKLGVEWFAESKSHRTIDHTTRSGYGIGLTSRAGFKTATATARTSVVRLPPVCRRCVSGKLPDMRPTTCRLDVEAEKQRAQSEKADRDPRRLLSVAVVLEICLI